MVIIQYLPVLVHVDKMMIPTMQMSLIVTEPHFGDAVAAAAAEVDGISVMVLSKWRTFNFVCVCVCVATSRNLQISDIS